MKYSLIIPVYNRREEIEELLESLLAQQHDSFEVVVVQDGSTERCDDIIARFQDRLNIQNLYKENSGPGSSRNYGMGKAKGDWFIIFDSDCLIPDHYLQAVDDYLSKQDVDTYGGPDKAHESFTNTQKAIDWAMTSYVTTGGIRGSEKSLDDYQPRSFNMGIKREVFEKVGGYGKIWPGEDPDLSFRIKKAGFSVGFIKDAYVYHKRRIDFRKFGQQVYKFGVVRNILSKWHPGTGKLVYAFPSLFLIGSISSLLLGLIASWYLALPVLLIALIMFVEALVTRKSLVIALLAVPAAFIQLGGYGFGYLKSFIKIRLLGQDEKVAFGSFFFE